MIREIQKKLEINNSYWIGGSTNAGENMSMEYFDYKLSSTGKENSRIMIFKVMIVLPCATKIVQNQFIWKIE